MTRADTAKAAAAALRSFAARADDTPVVIGFDGMVDSIIEVVDKRHSLNSYDPLATIAEFGQRVSAAAGKSSNIELAVTLEKLGGNGPIMANAMASLGLPVTYCGAVGYPTLHVAFQPLADRCDVMSFCEPGYTDALEFSDGKLMLGKHGSLVDANAESLVARIGHETFRDAVDKCRLLGMVNWTMLVQTDTIWQYLIDRVLPEIDRSVPRTLFVDLTDPAKRTKDDLASALATCAKLGESADVVMGFNLSESSQVAAVLGLTIEGDPEAAIVDTAAAIRAKLGVATVVIHPRSGAAAAHLEADGTVTTATFAGPFVEKPKLSTGAGDNFNAGFCLGRLADLPLEQCLCLGTAVSGFYVRNAHSPSLADLAAFAADLPAPEGG